mmetsp:Transcript_15698/g.37879  ORF Transcript_15698/g.37879 Transcript_15698/m.37879 type:complete len:208 (-) Transcript_15698:501-1124(-)
MSGGQRVDRGIPVDIPKSHHATVRSTYEALRKLGIPCKCSDRMFVSLEHSSLLHGPQIHALDQVVTSTRNEVLSVRAPLDFGDNVLVRPYCADRLLRSWIPELHLVVLGSRGHQTLAWMPMAAFNIPANKLPFLAQSAVIPHPSTGVVGAGNKLCPIWRTRNISHCFLVCLDFPNECKGRLPQSYCAVTVTGDENTFVRSKQQRCHL